MNKPLTVFIAIFFFALGIGAGYYLWGDTGPAPKTLTDSAGQTRYDVSVDDDPVFGPADARVTIVEFSDYQCPYCIKWYREVYARLMEEYKGQIRFVYRDFPLTSIHPEALPAAEAANCANEQGAYWQYHDALFSGQFELSADAYIQYASALGLDLQKFQACLKEGRYRAEIEADLNYAIDLGVQSTPTFFINGIPVIGAQPYAAFKQVIDKELGNQ
jgi:protein-disulfide isomerase